MIIQDGVLYYKCILITDKKTIFVSYSINVHFVTYSVPDKLSNVHIVA